MSFDAERDAAALERLSALVDGELDAEAAAQACGDWRERGEARAGCVVPALSSCVVRLQSVLGDGQRLGRVIDLSERSGRDAWTLAECESNVVLKCFCRRVAPVRIFAQTLLDDRIDARLQPQLGEAQRERPGRIVVVTRR